ncbi:MAG TPA: EamA family transporter [Terriglobia bacterium]|nr:EamA family transporter [Terriglobia bacterium]
MTLRTALFIGIIVVAGQGGDISLSMAMKQMGEVKSFTPRNLARTLGRSFQIGWMWLGIGLMAVGFFSLLALLSWANVSLVVPATASSYIVGAMGAQFLLGERVDKMRWIGVLIVCVGVAIVCAA